MIREVKTPIAEESSAPQPVRIMSGIEFQRGCAFITEGPLAAVAISTRRRTFSGCRVA